MHRNGAVDSVHISLPIALHPGHSKEHGQIIMSALMLSHREEHIMKELYLPEAKNDSIFAFVGNVYSLILVGVIVIALITFIVIMIRKKRKGDKK